MKRILFLLTLMGFLSVNLFSQEIPKQFNYQGVLKEGSVLVDGNYPFTFRIYNEPTGGSALWTESQTILVENGLFSAHLGSVTPIAGVPFNRIHFLGITIGTGAELAPRSMLTPSAYSFMSMDVMDEAITTAKIHDGAVTGDKIGSNQVVKSLNGIKDDVTLVGGTNITLTPSGNNITINAEGIGGGTVTEVNTGAGLTGGPITTAGTISIPNDGITGAMLQSNSVTSAKIADGTIVTADLGDNSVTSAKIVDGTIATADLGNNSVTSAKIVDATITGTDIANNTIGPEKLNFTPGTGTIGGSGTTNHIPVFTNNTTLGNSIVSQSSVGVTVTSTAASNINPTLSLTRTGTNSATSIRFTNSAGNNFNLGMRSDGKFGISSSNNNVGMDDALVINSSNKNIGIGTTSPSYPLHINANISTASIYSVNLATGIYSAGVYGKANQLDWYGTGGYFIGGYHGVYGDCLPTGTGSYYGVRGTVGVIGGSGNAGSRYGVYGIAVGTGTGTRYGIYGTASGGTTNWAGYFSGNMRVTGIINPSAIESVIDHPLDPANKYLYHSSVESPDMKNIYDGNVVTDGSGYATVTLPEWFEALNKDLRYQLTVIGDFAQAIIAQEVQGNQFSIRTDKPNIKVSWQVTGIRKDAFAEKNRKPVEELKQGDEVGKYIHPDAFGLPESMGIDYERNREGLERENISR